MMSTKKNKDVKDDVKKGGENMDEKTMNQNGEQKDEREYFKIPKPRFPKLNKEVVLTWLKRIGILLLGVVTGVAATVIGAAKYVASKEPEKDEFEDSDGDAEENEIEEDESPSEDDEA